MEEETLKLIVKSKPIILQVRQCRAQMATNRLLYSFGIIKLGTKYLLTTAGPTLLLCQVDAGELACRAAR